jgi:hypothetical protein
MVKPDPQNNGSLSPSDCKNPDGGDFSGWAFYIANFSRSHNLQIEYNRIAYEINGTRTWPAQTGVIKVPKSGRMPLSCRVGYIDGALVQFGYAIKSVATYEQRIQPRLTSRQACSAICDSGDESCNTLPLNSERGPAPDRYAAILSIIKDDKHFPLKEEDLFKQLGLSGDNRCVRLDETKLIDNILRNIGQSCLVPFAAGNGTINVTLPGIFEAKRTLSKNGEVILDFTQAPDRPMIATSVPGYEEYTGDILQVEMLQDKGYIEVQGRRHLCLEVKK